MCKTAKEAIRNYKTSQRASGWSARAINKKLLAEEFERININEHQVLLVAKPSIDPSRLIAILVCDNGRVFKTIHEDKFNEGRVSLYRNSKFVKTKYGMYDILQELGVVPGTTCKYKTIKLPYSEYELQPTVHCLVAIAFGLFDDVTDYELVVNHMDGSIDNKLSNLEIITERDNIKHGHFKNYLMNKYTFITEVGFSGKDAHMLNKFKPAIEDMFNGLNTGYTTFGSRYTINAVLTKNSKSEMEITGYLEDTNTDYINPITFKIDKNEYIIQKKLGNIL